MRTANPDAASVASRQSLGWAATSLALVLAIVALISRAQPLRAER